MATMAAAVFAGALLGIALISRIPIWALRAWKEKSLLRLILAHLITYGFAALVYAFALADGGPPQWQTGFATYALPSLLVFTLDTIAILASGQRGASQIADDISWFLHSGASQSGPLTTEAVQASLAQGTVKSSDWIWRNGLKEWVPIHTVDFSKAAVAEPAAAESKTDDESNYFLRHWRGAISLPVSYWICGLLIAILFVVPYLVLVNLELANHPRLISAGVIGLWLTLLAAMAWLSIGVFRTADHYATVNPKQHWGSAAKVVTGFAALLVLFIFVRQGIPEIRDSASIISETSQPRYAIRLLRDNTELELVGPMDFGVSEAIAASLKAHPSIATLHLNSPGGRLSEADRLTEVILQKNLNTYVSTNCIGSCATVFAAGKNRWLSRSAVLALHQPYFPGTDAADLAARTAQTKAFLHGRGIAAQLVDRGLAAPQDAAWRPSHAELFNAGFATAYATDAEVAVAGIPVREIEDAEKALDSIGLYQVLRDKHPKAHDEILAIVRNGYIKGQSAAAMRQRIWAVIVPIMNKSLPSASDSALVSFYRIAADEAEAFAEKDARSCEAFLKGRSEGFDSSLLSAELQEREMIATAELIRSSGSFTGKPIEKKDVEATVAQVLRAAHAGGLTPADFQQAIQFKLDSARNCRGMILFFRSLLELSDPSRTALLRFMAQQSGT